MVVKYFEHTPAHGGYRERDTYKDGAWALFVSPNAGDLADLAEQFNLSATQLAHVRDRETLPRLEFLDEATYLFIRHAYTNPHGERETAPLLMVIKPEVLLVVVPRPFAQELITDKATKTLRGTTLQVITHVMDQYGVFLDDIAHRIKTLRQSLHSHQISNADLANFVLLEEELNDFVASLEPLNAILQRLVLAHGFPLTSDENEMLGDLILKNQQLLSASTTTLRGIANLRNAHGTIATNNLNRTIKTLTVATVTLALPNVIFGSLGMNMEIPFGHSPWAYPLTVGVTVLITATVYLVARKRKIF